MKIILNEQQVKRLVEQTSGLDDFSNKILEKFFMDDIPGDYNEFANLLKDSISKSGCQKIEFSKFKNPGIGGLALHNKAVINEDLLEQKMAILIYAIFHEIGHQYQYRKYGAAEMYKLHRGELNDNELLTTIKKIEYTADQYGLRKAREFAQKGFFKLSDVPSKGVYSRIPDFQILKMTKDIITSTADKLQGLNDTQVSEYLYNSILNYV